MLITEPDGSKVYYVDYSILSTFSTCNEKARLSYKLKLEIAKENTALTFGSAFHAGVALLTCGYSIEDAKKAFVDECIERNSKMNINITDEGDRRTIERGLSLLEAYNERWKNEPYEALRDPSGKPYVEIGFRLFMYEWIDGIPIILCGLIDGIVRNKTNGGIYIKETKTTTMGLTQFMKQAKPNKQVSIYNYAAQELLSISNIAGTIWDCIFVSDRKVKDKGTYWETRGIDIDKDLARVTTYRSQTDMEELQFDLKHIINNYMSWYTRKDVHRWIRNDPTACSMYGGCQFADICISNCNPQIIQGMYREREWRPWQERALKLPTATQEN